MQKETIEWHKYPEEEPKHSGIYLVTVDETYLAEGVVNIDNLYYDKEQKIFGYFDIVKRKGSPIPKEVFVPFDDAGEQSILAWSERPKGYKEN